MCEQHDGMRQPTTAWLRPRRYKGSAASEIVAAIWRPNYMDRWASAKGMTRPLRAGWPVLKRPSVAGSQLSAFAVNRKWRNRRRTHFLRPLSHGLRNRPLKNGRLSIRVLLSPDEGGRIVAIQRLLLTLPLSHLLSGVRSNDLSYVFDGSASVSRSRSRAISLQVLHEAIVAREFGAARAAIRLWLRFCGSERTTVSRRQRHSIPDSRGR
jgi:hypothetical protein